MHLSDALDLWQATDGVCLTDSDDMPGLCAYLERNPGLSHVAAQRDEIVGAVLCGHDGRRGYLHHLAVRADHRKFGIGTGLVKACLASLKLVKIKRCNLFVFEENSRARSFWDHDGWFEWADIRLLQRVL